MKTKTACILISAMNIVGGILFNIREFMNDYWPVTFKNVIATLIYAAVWVLVFKIAIKNRYLGMIKAYSMFWGITCVLALITILIEATDINAGGAILLVIPFLSQWYGLRYFAADSMIISGIISILSVTIFANAYFFYKPTRNKQG